MNNKGQSILAEHVMIFFAVIAALTAMTAFVQRSFQARVQAARDFVVSSVASECAKESDNGCLNATGKITYEYEPYYTQEKMDNVKNLTESKYVQAGKPGISQAIYGKISNEQSSTTVSGGQVAPECADGTNPKPFYCP